MGSLNSSTARIDVHDSRRPAHARPWAPTHREQGRNAGPAAPPPGWPVACPWDPAGGRHMTCPYLKEVSMVSCRAYPVKKLVPIDRVTTANTCESESFKACPLFREALERAERSADADIDS